jgi:drug/metabolite transporter (DMT)-like permease
VPAGIASVIMGAVPLLTFFLAWAQRLERFRVRGLIGACLAIVGIGLISTRPSTGSLPILPLLAVTGAAASAAQSAITIRRIPGAHPLVTNAVGMTVGAALLLVVSAITGESWEAPTSWTAVALIVMIVTSPLLFVLFVFVIQRWSASAASYQFVLFPIVSILLAAMLLGEDVSASLLIGAPIVLLGVYVGALAGARRTVSPREVLPG